MVHCVTREPTERVIAIPSGQRSKFCKYISAIMVLFYTISCREKNNRQWIKVKSHYQNKINAIWGWDNYKTWTPRQIWTRDYPFLKPICYLVYHWGFYRGFLSATNLVMNRNRWSEENECKIKKELLIREVRTFVFLKPSCHGLFITVLHIFYCNFEK